MLTADPRVVACLLGGAETARLSVPAELPTAGAARYNLVGAVTEGSQGGYALIVINDQPARPYRVGAPVDDTLVLHSVAARSAPLATDVQAPAYVQLALSALAPAQSADPNR